MKKLTVTITDPAGMHTRPASILSKKAGEFEADMQIVYGQKKTSMKSIIGIMSLGISSQSTIDIIVDGPDEAQAYEAIETCLIDNHMIEKA